MATGNPTGIAFVGPHGASSTATATSLTLNGSAPIGTFRLAQVCINSTTATITNSDANWVKVYDSTAFGGFRQTVWVYRRWTGTANSSFSFSSSVWSIANENSWTGVDPDDPFLIAPSDATATGSTSSGTSYASATLSPGHNAGMPIWAWMVKSTTGSSSNVVTLPADLVSAGNIAAATAGSGFYGRSGAWLDSGGINGLTTPIPTGTKTATGNRTGTWRTVGMVLRPENNGSGMLPFFNQQS